MSHHYRRRKGPGPPPLDGPPEGIWIDHSYVIKLKGSHSKDDHLNWLNPLLTEHESEVTHADWDTDTFHGYAGIFKPGLKTVLDGRDDIEYIEKNMLVRDIVNSDYCTQTDAPWGLARLCCDKLDVQNAEADTRLDYKYTFHRTAGGGGMSTIYVLDTGVYVEHDDFDRGRATRGPSYIENQKGTTDDGHGTHCAGIAGGRRWGVAMEATLVSVKVFDQDGHGSIQSIIDGVNYVICEFKKDKYRRRIISYSGARYETKSIDEAFTNAFNAGVHVVVAAGNDGEDCRIRSPARVECIITVGNMTIDDEPAYDSNYGPHVDIWAPGENITSAWVGKKDAAQIHSGTSMACPHVAGLLACLISTECWHYSPKALKEKLLEYSRKNKLDDGASPLLGGPNNLAAQHLP